MRYWFIVLGVMVPLVTWPAKPAAALIMINEFLADPPAGLAGDANGDGVRSTGGDEFVELFNPTLGSIDISSWYLTDAAQTRHVFALETILQPKDIFVVFGGGSVNLPDVNWQVASTGTLSLNNGGDILSLYSDSDELIDQVLYDAQGGKDQSLVRSPEGSGENFVLHLDLPGAEGKRYSAGYFVDDVLLSETGETAHAVPEPMTLCSLGLGLPALFWRRRRG